MRSLLLAASFLVSAPIFAVTGILDEEVYIQNASPETIKLIKDNPALTIDHKSSLGFELYGPKGMSKWLKTLDIDFIKSSHGHHKGHNSSTADYPSFEKVEANLKRFVAMNPKIAKLISIGKSVKGRDLWIVKISDNVEIDEVEPEFKFISSMHGDEITGRELTQFLIADIIKSYGNNKAITDLVNNTEIYIMPSMNPDGSERRARANANRVDLNRNFPDWLRGDLNTDNGRQPETKAIMSFQASRKFALSANFHGGVVCVNYPWDNTYDKHPLDKLVKEISLDYSRLNPPMFSSREFTDGVTNGAAWYVLRGGMQDWSYYFHNDLQVTIELSDKKWPKYSKIPSFYKDNKDSMLAYVTAIHRGAGVSFADKSESGTIKIVEHKSDKNIKRGSFGFDKGEFYKVLPNGIYTFYISTKSGSYFEKEVIVTKEISENGNFINL